LRLEIAPVPLDDAQPVYPDVLDTQGASALYNVLQEWWEIREIDVRLPCLKVGCVCQIRIRCHRAPAIAEGDVLGASFSCNFHEPNSARNAVADPDDAVWKLGQGPVTTATVLSDTLLDMPLDEAQGLFIAAVTGDILPESYAPYQS
jgi:hypothetical protein